MPSRHETKIIAAGTTQLTNGTSWNAPDIILRLARATGLGMVEAGWRPTVGNYIGFVTKARILEAVQGEVGDRAAQLIDPLKKGDRAREAERLLADRGWLPESLRFADLDTGTGLDVSVEASADADDDDEHGALVAAE